MEAKKKPAKRPEASKREPTRTQVDAAESRAIAEIGQLMGFICKHKNLDRAITAVCDLRALYPAWEKVVFKPMSQRPSENERRRETAQLVLARVKEIRAEMVKEMRRIAARTPRLWSPSPTQRSRIVVKYLDE